MSIRPEVWPFIISALLVGLLLFLLIGRFSRLKWKSATYFPGILTLIAVAYFLWFFRDPLRIPPTDPSLILSGADGEIAKIALLTESEFRDAAEFAGLETDDLVPFSGGKTLRVSIFLSLFSVHVNRFPISGQSRFMGYFPGKHLFTFDEKSSDVNQHNSILITNDRTACLVNQIVGPVCRRVVYWLNHDESVDVKAGDDFGMMKFGSRLDMYFPEKDIKLSVIEGDKVRAGESVIGKYSAVR